MASPQEPQVAYCPTLIGAFIYRELTLAVNATQIEDRIIPIGIVIVVRMPPRFQKAVAPLSERHESDN